jgi:dTDP-4-dehydrorhamnose reductase
MKILLLGANGQLGTDLIAANTESAHTNEVTCVLRAELDVSEPERIASVIDAHSFDVLVNCTGYHKTDEVEHNGARAVAINSAAPQAMAKICAAKGARFIHISTDYVFGGYGPVLPLRETDAPAPVNVYGATKLLGENLAFAANPNTLVLRVASLFGVAGASSKGGNFVETMLRIGKEKGELRVVSDQVMSPTATADIARWIFTLLERRAPAGLYHAVNTGATTWYNFARTIIEKAGIKAVVSPIPSSAFPTPATRPQFSALDNSKLAAFVGPIRNWEQALDDYLAAKGHV